MKLIVLIVVLFMALYGCSALSGSELEAISSLYEAWPALRNARPMWTSNASEACNEPPFAGLSCSGGPDPHVISLYVAIDGLPFRAAFSQLHPSLV